MTLKIVLKPNERLLIGKAVIRNGDAKCCLSIENNVPILREKEIIGESQADSPARRIYFSIQLMYIDEENLVIHHKNYWKLVRDFVGAAPSATALIEQINELILAGAYYKALKLTKQLIAYEKDLIESLDETDRAVSPD